MRIYSRNGEIIPAGIPFELTQEIEVDAPIETEVDGEVIVTFRKEKQTGKVAYPWNWLDVASADDLKARGISVEEVPDVMPVPPTISDRQFFQQLAVENIISQDDALAAVKVGAVPAALSALIDSLPADQKFGAEMLVSGATVFERAHPLTVAIGQAYGWDGAKMDDFWRAAAAL